MDRYLDTIRTGPRYLSRPDVAQVVVDTLQYAANQLASFDLHAYVVMPNHVHVLVTPHIAPSRLLKSVKSFSARRANQILRQAGRPFWQSESYDHWVRDGDEFRRIQSYIEENPVKAGLVKRAEDYRWSSAWRGDDEVARASRRAASACGPT